MLTYVDQVLSVPVSVSFLLLSVILISESDLRGTPALNDPVEDRTMGMLIVVHAEFVPTMSIVVNKITT